MRQSKSEENIFISLCDTLTIASLGSREGFYGSAKFRVRKEGRSPRAPLAVILIILLTVAGLGAVQIRPVGDNVDVGNRVDDLSVAQEWAKYIFHMDPNNSTQMHFVNVTMGLESDPNVIFNGVFADELHNQSMAENLSALVNNYTYFFNNASGGGHWLAAAVAPMIPIVRKIKSRFKKKRNH